MNVTDQMPTSIEDEMPPVELPRLEDAAVQEDRLEEALEASFPARDPLPSFRFD